MNNYLVNRALLFTADYFNHSNRNFGKPVYFHCVNVAYKAIEFGYSDLIVVGAVMHDLLEDTLCTQEEIAEEFGEKVGDLVYALSFDTESNKRLQKNIDTIDKCRQFGKEALIIKCLDVADTVPYYFLSSPEDQEYLRLKIRYLIDICQDSIKEELAFDYLVNRINEQSIDLTG